MGSDADRFYAAMRKAADDISRACRELAAAVEAAGGCLFCRGRSRVCLACRGRAYAKLHT